MERARAVACLSVCHSCSLSVCHPCSLCHTHTHSLSPSLSPSHACATWQQLLGLLHIGRDRGVFALPASTLTREEHDSLHITLLATDVQDADENTCECWAKQEKKEGGVDSLFPVTSAFCRDSDSSTAPSPISPPPRRASFHPFSLCRYI